MIVSGHKSDKIFAHYANHIKKESALKTIAATSERLFAPILDSFLVDEVEFTVHDDQPNGQKLIACDSNAEVISA